MDERVTQGIKGLVDHSFAKFSDAELIYLRNTKARHTDSRIAVTIILRQREAKARAEKEAREVERHREMGVWIGALKRLHWTAWIMFLVGIASMLIALFAWRAPVA